MTASKITKDQPGPVRAIGYRRCSTTEQSDSGHGLNAQQDAVNAAVEQRRWTLLETATDVASGKSLKKRPELARILRVLDRGEADALVVSKLDRLSRSLPDAAALLERAQKHGWSLVVLDLGVDTSTSTGRLIAHVISSVAQFEREQIGERTRDALAAASARGVRIGRPSSTPAEVLRMIGDLHVRRFTPSEIARTLNEAGVPTAQGGAKWWPQTVTHVLGSKNFARITGEAA